MGFARTKAHITGAEHHHPIGQLQLFQYGLRAFGHALMFIQRAIRRADGDHFNLFKLMLAQHAGGVFAR